MSLDIRFLEVMVSRICHDLISPISAVTNGAELVADLGSVSAGDEAFDLIRQSATAAAIKLSAFRLAYGAGGAEWHISMDDVEKNFGDYIRLEKRYSVHWGMDNSALPNPLKRGLPKVTMLGLMWAMEMLPRGGEVAIAHNAQGGFDITANGEGAKLRDGTMDAFHGTIKSEELSPKLVHAAAIGVYAKDYDISVHVDDASDIKKITISA